MKIPAVGRMLSADKYVQDPMNTQAYNRYAYCLNNPLKYSDPSGWRYAKAPAEPMEATGSDNSYLFKGGYSGAYASGSTYNYASFYSLYANNPIMYSFMYGMRTTMQQNVGKWYKDYQEQRERQHGIYKTADGGKIQMIDHYQKVTYAGNPIGEWSYLDTEVKDLGTGNSIFSNLWGEVREALYGESNGAFIGNTITQFTGYEIPFTTPLGDGHFRIFSSITVGKTGTVTGNANYFKSDFESQEYTLTSGDFSYTYNTHERGYAISYSTYGFSLSSGFSLDAGITFNASAINGNGISSGFSISFMPNKYAGLAIAAIIGTFHPELIPILSRIP